MEKKIFNTKVSTNYHNYRIDKFLQSQLNNISRTRLQNLIYEGYVKLNNTVIYETSKKIKEADEIKIDFPPPKETLIKPQKIPLNILYDDNDIIIIFDNEPRNREICKQMDSCIRFYKNIVIWPDSMKHKDINDMIMAGYTKKQIQEIIDDNTFSGVAAQLRFAEWKKIDEGSMGKAIRRKEATLEL